MKEFFPEVETTPRSIQVFTIGHSNRSFEEFLGFLRKFEIRTLVDIRRFPGSRKFPHFNHDALVPMLKAEGIEYLWLESLGGFRHSEKNKSSPNTGLESSGFRNYADHIALTATSPLQKTTPTKERTTMVDRIFFMMFLLLRWDTYVYSTALRFSLLDTG